ncbi:hypothetical protein GF345_04615 [Candidatus Woesearchaeota archaeon]|nr:hypothetical protein [Candidatus Woesearchaeota archaeon]
MAMTSVAAVPMALRIIISVITLVLMIPLSALGLWISANIFKIRRITYVRALLPALILAFAGFVITIPQWFYDDILIALVIGSVGFLVSAVLYLVLPKLFFDLEWKKGLLVGLVWFGLMMVIGFVIGMIVGILAFVIGIALGIMAAV